MEIDPNLPSFEALAAAMQKVNSAREQGIKKYIIIKNGVCDATSYKHLSKRLSTAELADIITAVIRQNPLNNNTPVKLQKQLKDLEILEEGLSKMVPRFEKKNLSNFEKISLYFREKLGEKLGRFGVVQSLERIRNASIEVTSQITRIKNMLAETGNEPVRTVRQAKPIGKNEEAQASLAQLNNLLKKSIQDSTGSLYIDDHYYNVYATDRDGAVAEVLDKGLVPDESLAEDFFIIVNSHYNNGAGSDHGSKFNLAVLKAWKDVPLPIYLARPQSHLQPNPKMFELYKQAIYELFEEQYPAELASSPEKFRRLTDGCVDKIIRFNPNINKKLSLQNMMDLIDPIIKKEYNLSP